MSDTDLSLAAFQLSQAAPREWEKFMAAMGEYTTTRTTNLISSPLEELQRSQGRAQALTGLLRSLQNCRIAVSRRGHTPKE